MFEFLSDAIWGGTGAVASAVTTAPSMAVSALPALAKPSLWEAFTQPFAQTLSSLSASGPGIANVVGQSLQSILLQKAGLLPVSTPSGSGTVINYQTPQAGTAAPVSINLAQPAASGAAGGSGGLTIPFLGTNVNWVVVIVIGACVLGLIIVLARK